MSIILKDTENQSLRPSKTAIDTVVIHFTGSNNGEGTVSWFRNPMSKVSAHFVIDRSGQIYQFVPEKHKAWHAGKSSWKGRKNVNNFSIGIELVGISTQLFTEEQYESLIGILRKLRIAFDIKEENVIGHEHVSPGRKVDPGRYFDWLRVYSGVYNNGEPKKAYFNKTITPTDVKFFKIPKGKDPVLDNFLERVQKLFSSQE